MRGDERLSLRTCEGRFLGETRYIVARAKSLVCTERRDIEEDPRTNGKTQRSSTCVDRARLRDLLLTWGHRVSAYGREAVKTFDRSRVVEQ